MSALDNLQGGQFGPQGQQSYGQRVRNLASNGPLLDASVADLNARHPIAGPMVVGAAKVTGRVAGGVSRAAQAMNNDSGAGDGGGNDEAPPAAPAGNPYDPHPGLTQLQQAMGPHEHPQASIMRGETAQAPAPQPMPQRAAQAPSPFSASVNPRSPVAGGMTGHRNSGPVVFGGQGMAVSRGDRIRAQGSLGTARQSLGVNSVPSQNGIGQAQARSQEMQAQQGGG